MKRFSTILILIVFLTSGCGGEEFENSTPSPDAEPWLELGAGLYAYENLEDGDTIELVHGFQGGWHVDMAIRFGDLGPSGIHLTYQATDSTNGDLISYITETTLRENQVQSYEEGWERSGDRIVFDIGSAQEVIGRDLQLHVTARLGDVSLEDTRRATIVDDAP